MEQKKKTNRKRVWGKYETQKNNQSRWANIHQRINERTEKWRRNIIKE